MFCRNCGTQLKENAKFCHSCGRKVEKLVTTGFSDDLPITETLKTATFDSPEVAALRNSVEKHVEAGDYDCALETCEKILNLNPSDAGALSARGTVYALSGEEGKAKKDFNDALAINPGEADAYAGQAILHVLQENSGEAMRCINRAININHSESGYYSLRVTLHVAGENWDAVIDDVGKALGLSPKESEKATLFSQRGAAYLNKGDVKKAGEDLDASISLNPSEGAVHFLRAVVYIQLENTQEAMSELNDAIEADPDDADSLELRAKIYIDAEDRDSAMADLDAAIALNPDNIDELVELKGKLEGEVDLAQVGGFVGAFVAGYLGASHPVLGEIVDEVAKNIDGD